MRRIRSWKIAPYSLCQVITLVAFSAVRQILAFGDPTLPINEGAHE